MHANVSEIYGISDKWASIISAAAFGNGPPIDGKSLLCKKDIIGIDGKNKSADTGAL
ncbi:hypothetical protein HYD_2330 [Candidatus Hydrogenosomobacter endosymbioticus]|uniref:Uncharacterized protein n=1 Tax=Candidatus Hydrogenosomobacter endosymbioticus TaxID=2558174 RepID=A0ABM7V8J7_9PROT|nr:hypothetical protein HYD_2330 [Candidatus Hydrogenosomobacter endosymbioticus]